MRSTGDYYLSGDILQESFTRYLEKYGEEGRRSQGRDTVLFDEQDHTRHNPESHMMVREDYRRVLAAMQALEQEERDILSLVVSSGLSYREIARVVGTSEANVKVRIHRTRVKLKKIMNAGDI